MEPILFLEGLDADEEMIPTELRPGDDCPQCRQGKLDYGSMLDLACMECGYSLAGCFT